MVYGYDVTVARLYTGKYDVIRKPEVHNILQRRQRRTEPYGQALRVFQVSWNFDISFLKYASG